MLDSSSTPDVLETEQQPAAANLNGSTGQIKQALSTAETTVLQTGGFAMSEPAAEVFQSNGGVWQTVVFANIVDDAGNPRSDRWDYGCKRDDQSNWCDYDFNWSSVSQDPTLVAQHKSNDNVMYHGRMWNHDGGANDGVLWSRSTDPCPSGCGSPTWKHCSAAIGGMDLPKAIHAANDEVWWTWSSYTDSVEVVVSRFPNDTCGTFSRYARSCPDTSGHMLRANVGVMDSFGKVHLFWHNSTTQEVQTDTFDTNTLTWSCNTKTVGTAAQNSPGPRCSSNSSSVRTYSTLGTDLQAGTQLTAAIQRSGDGDTIVVAYSTSSGMSDNKKHMRIYRSYDGGSYSWRVWTPNESAQPQVRAAQIGSNRVDGHFELNAISELGNSNGDFKQTRWLSTDDGSSWAGFLFGSLRNHGPLLKCYWGHYVGLAPHPTEDKFFYAWTQPENGSTGPWVIRGQYK